MPSELLWQQWSRSSAGFGVRGSSSRLPGSSRLPESSLRHSPGPGSRARRGGQRQSCATVCAWPLRPEDTVQVQAAPVGVWLHPPPLPALCFAEGGCRREARQAEGVRGRERGCECRRGEGGGRGRRSGERVLTLAPRTLGLVLATSQGDDQEKLAGASFPTGIKQVMASHLRGGCRCSCSGQGAARSLSTRIPSLQATSSGRAFLLLL